MTPVITVTGLFFCYALLLIPLGIGWKMGLGLNRPIIIAAFRMSFQLFLAGLFLKYLFKDYNHL